ncbi:MAG: hypothetical protein AAB492_04200 [Patescibacteria group bacterium]
MQHKSISVTFVEFLTPLILFITPLLFLPFFSNFFGTPKQILIVTITLILLLGLTVDILVRRVFPMSLSPLRLPLVFFVAAVIANVLINPEGRTESIIGLGSLLTALAVLSYVISLLPQSSKLASYCINAIIASSALLSIHGIFQLTFLHRWSVLPSFMQNEGFTPTGSPLTTVSVLTIASIVAFIKVKSQKPSLIKYLTIAFSLLSMSTVIIHTYLMVSEGFFTTTILPFGASWNIMLDTLKNTHYVFFGVGIASFSTLYTVVKPLFLNTTPFWNILPATATTEIFQWITTTGLLGTATFMYLIAIGFRQIAASKSTFTPINVVFILSTLTFFLTPGSIPLYLLFFVSLGLIASDDNENIIVPKTTSYILSLILIAFIGYSGFYLVQVARAEYYLNQAKIALSKNDTKIVYESSLKAIQLVPSMTNYRLSYSQVNLSLAAAISQKSDLTDAEKQNVNQLVSQSIREGKLATSLRPHDALTWQNLGTIYANLLTVVDGADEYAITSYAQAVSLDAGNPVLRTEFANLLVKLSANIKNQTQKNTYLSRAATEFQTAIQLKPDYAGAYYNFAKLLESAGDYQSAYTNMQKAIGLIDSASPDLSRATQELNEIKAKVPTPTP